jgi:hypothetical protein
MTLKCKQWLQFTQNLNFHFQADGTGTVAMDDRFEKLKESVPTTTSNPQTNGIDEAAGASAADDEAAGFNENLFLDEDLEGLDDELNDLDI